MGVGGPAWSGLRQAGLVAELSGEAYPQFAGRAGWVWYSQNPSVPEGFFYMGDASVGHPPRGVGHVMVEGSGLLG